MEESIFSIESKDEINTEQLLENQNNNNDSLDIVVPSSDFLKDVIKEDSNLLDIDLSSTPDNVSQTVNKDKKGFLSLFGKKDSNKITNEISSDKNADIISNNEGGSIIGSQSNKNGGDIFQDLDLGSLSFLEESGNNNQKPAFNPLIFTRIFSGAIFWILLLGTFGFYINALVLSLDSDFIHSIPGVCDYIGTKIDGYDNSTKCFSLSKILDEKTKEYTDLENNILKSLAVLIPKKIQTNYIISSPEVKFIQEKHTSDKIYVNKIFEDFEALRTSNKPFDGLNIECSNFMTDETGILEVNCIFYGASISNIGNNQELKTSRTVALDYLKRLDSSASHFKVLDYPKNLSIQESNSTDGIKSRFTTQTSIPLKLQYTLESKL